ncbi:DSC E3 ubiquitin ligase complex subunit 2 [Pseudozyma hubeiensis]|nr:DSC E3 ubiquitin ligase complex subunit 2 [Pseudozyma hubeiensis]
MVAGFAHAPVTKTIIIITSITTILSSLFRLTPYLHLQLHPHLSTHHQFYRLVTQHFAFTNSSELFLALLLFYHAGVKVERVFGSYKYASFLVVTTGVYTVMQVMLLGFASAVVRIVYGAGKEWWLSSGSAPAGPFGPLFAILYQYHRTIPPLYTFKFANFTLTDQDVSTHSLSLLLAISQPFSSTFSALLAISISHIYSSTRLKEYRINPRMYRTASWILTPWVGGMRVPQRSWRVEWPTRRSREVRQARLAGQNARVTSVGRQGMGMSGGLASLLRRRGAADAPPATTRMGTTGWNDVPATDARVTPS